MGLEFKGLGFRDEGVRGVKGLRIMILRNIGPIM